jgi:hypothetical protein
VEGGSSPNEKSEAQLDDDDDDVDEMLVIFFFAKLKLEKTV